MNSATSMLPRGAMFVRYAAALGLAKGNLTDAAEMAGDRWGGLSGPARWLRAAVPAGGTLPLSDWGTELSDYRAAASEFFGLVRDRSIVGRLAGLRRLPFGVAIIEQTQGAVASWVRQGSAKPISEMKFARLTIEALKLSSIVVVTSELLALSDAASETRLRDDLAAAIALTLDETFLDPANGGIAEHMPASITNGIAPIAGTGDPGADIAALIGAFDGDLSAAYLVMRPEIAASMSDIARPNVGARGGEISGIPVVTGPGAPDNAVILIDPTGIAFAEDTLALSAGQQGTLEMVDSAQTGVATLSLWQNNLTALRAEQHCNWQRARAGSVAVLSPLGP